MSLKNCSTEKNHDLYPSYKEVQKEKKQCYPNNIETTGFKTEVPLQDLVDHTSMRLIDYLTPVFIQLIDLDNVEHGQVYDAVLISKWGFDSATSQSRYKQSVSDAPENFNEESLLSTSIVPLDLSMSDQLVWRNHQPSSLLPKISVDPKNFKI